MAIDRSSLSLRAAMELVDIMNQSEGKLVVYELHSEKPPDFDAEMAEGMSYAAVVGAETYYSNNLLEILNWWREEHGN